MNDLYEKNIQKLYVKNDTNKVNVSQGLRGTFKLINESNTRI